MITEKDGVIRRERRCVTEKDDNRERRCDNRERLCDNRERRCDNRKKDENSADSVIKEKDGVI